MNTPGIDRFRVRCPVCAGACSWLQPTNTHRCLTLECEVGGFELRLIPAMDPPVPATAPRGPSRQTPVGGRVMMCSACRAPMTEIAVIGQAHSMQTVRLRCTNRSCGRQVEVAGNAKRGPRDE